MLIMLGLRQRLSIQQVFPTLESPGDELPTAFESLLRNVRTPRNLRGQLRQFGCQLSTQLLLITGTKQTVQVATCMTMVGRHGFLPSGEHALPPQRPGSKQLGHRKSTAQTQEYRTGLKRATSSLLSGTEWKRLSRVWNDWEAFQVEGVPAGLSPRLLGNTQLAL